MIKITGLHKYFNRGKKNELHVLDGIDLEFADHGLVCILGESGSGKTTLLNVLGGLDVFAKGQIQVDDTVLEKYRAKEIELLRNDKFGYIFQNYYLLQDYTVAYNVKLALNTFDIPEEEKDKRVEYVLEQLGILKYKKKLVSQLSGGQQQRVSIARALVKAPKIILADEPTGNLDEENTLRTMSILKNISKDCLVILVSHERRIANFFADRIIEIRDGRIQKDYKNRNSDAYERMDDGNIYLKDLSQVMLSEKENAQISLYGTEEDVKQNISLRLAWKNGKLYIQNLSECDVLLAGQEAGCELVDDHKPDVDMSSVEKFEFSLPHIKADRASRLTRKEIWKMAMENIRLMGKKQAFIIGILLVTAVMLTITLANFTNSYFFNKKQVLTSDSHYVTVRASSSGKAGKADYDKAFEDFCEKYAFQGKYSDIFRSNGGSLLLQYDGFMQLNAAEVAFDEFSYISLDHVKKDELVCGRMPETSWEIVVDKWLFDKFFESDSPFKTLFKSQEDFLGTKLLSSITGDEFEIVGICDKEEPSIYMNQNRAMGLSVNSERIAGLAELQAEYPGEYDNITLGETEALVSETEWEAFKRRNSDSFTIADVGTFRIAGFFPDEFAVDYVLAESACLKVRNAYILNSKGYNLYTENPKNAIKELKKYAKNYSDSFLLTVTNENQKELAKFEKARKENVTSRNLIAVAAMCISMFMIYFMIKSNVVSRTEELTVYRLIGIAKGSIVKAYLLEMFLITSYTTLPAVIVTSGIIKFIGSIPSLELGITYPWWAAAGLIGLVYVLNLLISIVPVHGILSKPPAVLAVKG